MTTIQTADLSRWYGEVVGVNGVTFDSDAPILGLLGPNGAGKSTFLNLLTGQLKPSSGQLRVLGETPWGHRPLQARLGFVPETDTFWEWMSGLEFVTRLTRLHGFAPAEAAERARQALHDVQLQEDAWQRRLGTYSRGMRQKAKLAQAIAHEPDMLILDEPLTGADPVSRRHINELVRAKAAAGVHVVFSSHILHEVEALTHDIAVLSRGRLVARGKVEDIRALMDERPMRVRLEVSEPRTLAGELIDMPGVVAVHFGPSATALEVETQDVEAFYRRVPQACLDHDLHLTHVDAADTDLESLFDYLFEGRGGAEG